MAGPCVSVSYKARSIWKSNRILSTTFNNFPKKREVSANGSRVSSLTAINMADEASTKRKADKKRSTTEVAPHLDAYKFTDEVDDRYLKNIDDVIWQAGTSDVQEERTLPRPPWATLVWGPVPMVEDTGLVKKFITPGTGGGKKQVS